MLFLKSYIHKDALPRASLKRLHKGQRQICLIFWCGEHPCKITTSYRQFLRSCCIHKVFLHVTHLILRKFRISKRSEKGQFQTHPRFGCGKYPCKVTWCMQFLQNYHIHKAVRLWASSKVTIWWMQFSFDLDVGLYIVPDQQYNMYHDTLQPILDMYHDTNLAIF